MDEKEQNTAEMTAETAEEQTEKSNGTAPESEVPSEETAATEHTDSDGKDAEEKPIDWLAEIVDILETMLISVFSILLIFAYLMRPVTVEGRSMVPTLNDKDKLVMFRLFYQPKVGDVVVIDSHGGKVFAGDKIVDSGAALNECIIKRIVAVGGQKVDFVGEDLTDENGEYMGRTYHLYVDDVLQDESFINETMWKDDGAFEYPITVPEGYVFVMGDNRNHSSDSRSIYVGLVDEKSVMGTAYFRYQPSKELNEGETPGSIGFIH